MSSGIKLFKCSVCGLYYRDVELAKKCKAWCTEHKSCNLEIAKYAVGSDKLSRERIELTFI